MKAPFRRLSVLGCVLVCGLAASVHGDVTPDAGMLRWPDVSATHIVFSYANDLWIVPKAGGQAQPLASPPGQETLAKFSPDGKSIAFVGNYDGGRDIYTIPTAGGVATRVTYHPGGESVCDWSPDGKNLIFLSSGFSGLGRQAMAYSVPATGGQYTKLPVPYSGYNAISPDGNTLAYTPHSIDTRTWKRYRGGMQTDIWLYNLKDNSAKKITDWEGTDTLPMYVPGGDGSVVYFLSDNGPEHRLNIWSYTIATGKREQVTSFKDDDVRWPSVGPGADAKGEVVFQLGSKLMLLNLGTRQSAEVKVAIPGDRPKVRARTIDAARNISGASISPSGKRVVVEARGELWSAPAKEGVIRNLTHTQGVAEREPSWSPDGKWIAYFSDKTGENELWVRPSDAKPPEEKKDDKKKDEDKKGEEKKGDGKAEPEAKPAEPKPVEAKKEPRKLTTLGPGYRFNPNWSPDSTMIAFTDQGGRVYLTIVETGETKVIDKDPAMSQVNASWSSDSKWIAYARSEETSRQTTVWIAEARTGEKHRVTSGMFAAGAPAFDRKGDWLFYSASAAVNNPVYSDTDGTYAYTNSEVLLMTPLRKDVKSPWLPTSDEETLKKDEPKKDDKKDDKKKDEKKDEKKDDAKKDDEKKDEGKKEEDKKAVVADDGVSGKWEGTVKGNAPELAGGLPIVMNLKLAGDGTLSGTITSMMGSGSVTGKYDKTTGEITMTITVGQRSVSLTGTLKDGQITGTWAVAEDKGEWTAKRSAPAGPDDKPADTKSDSGEKPKEVKIDFEGLERRAMQLPIGPGSFGQLAVCDGDKLIFTRASSRGSGDTGIRIFDYKSTEPKEEAVTGGGGWQLTADGKKMLVGRGGSLTIVDASSGGGKAQTVPTAGMHLQIDPHTEWKQIFNDAWRVMRDYFYEPTMHGVDWAAQRDHYGAMLDDAATREDVNWIISEMISELNVGHAYLGNPGDVEDQPSMSGGLLGADLVLETVDGATAYKIAHIIEGGAWDTDARGPLTQPGVDAKVGDFILAVNGNPIDTSKDPYAAFVGTAGKIVSLTVNAKPTMDGKEREVLIKPVGGEGNLRYREYIERKRAYVAEKTDGKIGYIYVPNTGVDGQNDLYRQYFGQRGTQALIIDERWNGGGQIPNRFIELMNRPNTNFWARRDGQDWAWPPDAHFGPKAMLINGLAGSGGDMFPWLFKQAKLGKLIGTRTWGGLVGISGNPAFVDGGTITVPTFGFYKTDGTWGIEGHGTDPDIEVLDDPSKMVNGGDPQLDAAIAQLNDELKSGAWAPPKRPPSPTYRKGMGIDPKDK
ncbi:MAG: PDZ domain-containing protein [Planctomycetota bacterium]